MKAIDLAGFEAKFQHSVDPWNYRGSPFEARKRKELLRACGSGKAGRSLELACAIGETSRALQSRCLRLLAVDGAPAALAEARRLTGTQARIDYRAAILPEQTPRGPFDLIIVSEIAYYLSPNALARLVSALLRALAPGGRIVVLHHVIPFHDTTQPPALAHAEMRRRLARHLALSYEKTCGRYRVVAFVRRKPSAAQARGSR